MPAAGYPSIATTAVTDKLATIAPSVGNVAGYFVWLDDAYGNEYGPSTVTDGSGNWTITGPVPQGIYTSFYSTALTRTTGKPYQGVQPYLVSIASNPPTAPNGLAIGAGGFWYDFYNYAGKGDESTDDTTALQNTINAVPSGAGTVVSEISVRRAGIKLTATVNIANRGLIVRGSGVGNPVDNAQPGRGTTISWQGAAGQAMFNVSDCDMLLFEDIYFEGNATNAPSDIFFFDATNQSHGANHRFYWNRCRFGSILWGVRAPFAGAISATNGLRFGGPNANNDQFFLQGCYFAKCGTAINCPNTQSIWGFPNQCVFDGCTTGVATSSSMTLVNGLFNGCGLDFQVNSTAQVAIFGYESENALNLVQVTALGGSFSAHGGGGVVHLDAITAGTYMSHAHCSQYGAIDLSGLKFTGAHTAKLQIRCDAAQTPGFLRVIDCNIPLADFDVIAPSSGDGLTIVLEDNGVLDHVMLHNGETYVPQANSAWTAWTPTIGGAGWALGNGTMIARFIQYGKMIEYSIIITWGSTSTWGANQLTLSLPRTSLTNFQRFVPSAGGLNSGVSNYVFGAQLLTTTSVGFITIGTNGLAGNVTSTVPWTVKANDQHYVSGVYESA